MKEIITQIYNEILKDLKKDYILADTIVKSAYLSDHLLLTAGIAVAICKELLLRGKNPEEICGININLSEQALIDIIRIASLLHDWGKDSERADIAIESAYIGHCKRSVNWTQEWLKNKIEKNFLDLIIRAIERHELKYNPKTLLEKIICLADSLASAGDRPELAHAENIMQLTKISETNYNLYQSVFEGEDGLVLILGDVDKVKSYVFETSKLPEIRGASEILNELNYDELKNIFKELLSIECLIYQGGGSFLAIAPEKLADDIINKIQNIYLTKTKIATISCVKSKTLEFFELIRGNPPYDNEGIKKLNGIGLGKWLLESQFGKDSTLNKGEWFNKKGFGELVSNLSSDLRYKKNKKECIPFYEAISIGERCKSCGKHVAIDKILIPDGTREPICEICNIKRDRGKGEKIRFLESFIEWVKINKNLDFNQIISKFPENLDELSKNFDYKIAFIYADGNNIGSLLTKARSPANYRRLSEILKKGTENSLFGALFKTFSEENLNEFPKLPFEIINLGGDDISLIIAAPFSFDFSVNFMKLFEENMHDLTRILGLGSINKVTVSLGLVICKSTYPIYFAEKIGESLLRAAKRRVIEEIDKNHSGINEIEQKKNYIYNNEKGKWDEIQNQKNNIESTISYLLIPSHIATESSEEIINQLYSFNDFLLTMRPYTLSEIRFLLKKVKNINDIISKTQQNTLMGILCKGPIQSMNFLYYQISRFEVKLKKKALELLSRINTTFNCKDGWKKINGEFKTPLLDLLEITKIIGDFNP